MLHVAFPIMNAEFRLRRKDLYYYNAEADRLAPIRHFETWRLGLWRGFPIDADDWIASVRAIDPPPRIVFDVGVDSGYTTFWLSELAERVFVLEAHPDNIAAIREQLKIRRVDNAEVFHTAVSDSVGEVTLWEGEMESQHALSEIGASDMVGKIKVPSTTLDAFTADHGVDRIDFLKVDVEGFEAEVFRGARALLEGRRVSHILFEYSPDFYRGRKIDPKLPIEILRQFGYTVTDLSGRPVEPEAVADGPQCNLMARPD